MGDQVEGRSAGVRPQVADTFSLSHRAFWTHAMYLLMSSFLWARRSARKGPTPLWNKRSGSEATGLVSGYQVTPSLSTYSLLSSRPRPPT